MEKIIKKASGKKSNIYSWGALAIFGLLAGLYGLMSSASLDNYFGRNDDTKAMISIMSVIIIGVSIISLLKAYTAAKMFITVCEDKVYGVAGNANMMLSKPFDVAYSEITDVKCSMSTLTLQCRSQSYIMSIEDASEVCELIKKQISKPINF